MKVLTRSVRLRIPGHWSDGWLYKEHLLLWTANGDLFYVPTSEITSWISRKIGRSERAVSEYLIFRNDWKKSQQFQVLQAVPSVINGFLECFQERQQLFINIDELQMRSTNTRTHEGYVLDTEVYAGRLMSATEQGVFETSFDPGFPDSCNTLICGTEAPAYSVAARSGKMAVSLGARGLQTKDIFFGEGSEWWRKAESTPYKRDGDFSLASSFSSYNLLNYVGESSPLFLRARTRQVPAEGHRNFPETLIESFGGGVPLSSSLFEAGLQKAVAEREDLPFSDRDHEALEDVRVVGNSGYHLLVSSPDESWVVDVSAYPGESIGLRKNPTFRSGKIDPSLVSMTLSTQALRSGFLLETFDRTAVVTENGSQTLIDDPRVRLRSFPRSKRHDDCFLAVGDDYVELIGFLEFRV